MTRDKKHVEEKIKLKTCNPIYFILFLLTLCKPKKRSAENLRKLEKKKKKKQVD